MTAPVTSGEMSLPTVLEVLPGTPAAIAGLCAGDELLAINGVVPNDVIEYQQLIDDADPIFEMRRDGDILEVPIPKIEGEPIGLRLNASIFDRVQTCDNHCEFCFIYQLPPGMRKSLYLKDDDYRLSFLYGNFTTLTRFTELDLARVVEDKLGPLYVSIHATDPDLRSEMLRNRRGATSLRWLSALLDAGVTVHGQVVLCPGINNGAALEQTLAETITRYPSLATLGIVPLGLSKYNKEENLRVQCHGTRKAGALGFAAGQFRRRPLAEVRDGQPLEPGIDTPLDLGAGQAAEPQPQRHVSPNAHPAQKRLLHHGSHAPSESEKVPRTAEIHLVAAEQHTAASGPDQQAEKPEQGGLSRPVLSDKGQDLTAAHREVRDVEHRAAVVRHGDVVKLEDALAQRVALRCWKKESSKVMTKVSASRMIPNPPVAAKLMSRRLIPCNTVIPSPFTEIIEAITTMAKVCITTWLTPSISVRCAEGNATFHSN